MEKKTDQRQIQRRRICDCPGNIYFTVALWRIFFCDSFQHDPEERDGGQHLWGLDHAVRGGALATGLPSWPDGAIAEAGRLKALLAESGTVGGVSPGPAGSVVHGWPGTHRAVPLSRLSADSGRLWAKSLALWWVETQGDPSLRKLGTGPPFSLFYSSGFWVATPPPSGPGYALETCRLLSFQLRTPLCSGTAQPSAFSLSLSLSLVLFAQGGGASAPTLPPFLDVLAPPSPIKCQ